jgi:hypothetical protein
VDTRDVSLEPEVLERIRQAQARLERLVRA